MTRMRLFAAAEFSSLLLHSKRPPASQFVGCVGVGIARKLRLPQWQGKVPGSDFAGGSRSRSEKQAQELRRAKLNDPPRWRTHSTSALDAHSRPGFHCPARLSLDGRPTGG